MALVGLLNIAHGTHHSGYQRRHIAKLSGHDHSVIGLRQFAELGHPLFRNTQVNRILTAGLTHCSPYSPHPGSRRFGNEPNFFRTAFGLTGGRLWMAEEAMQRRLPCSSICNGLTG